MTDYSERYKIGFEIEIILTFLNLNIWLAKFIKQSAL